MTESAPVRIANASGFYGDRFGAMREMLEGGELDVLTGDYLAELTMLILGRDRLRDSSLGYARTFLTAVVRRCHLTGRRDVSELWRLLTIASSSELRGVVADTPAQPFLEPENARMFGSIRSVTSSAAAALEHIRDQRAASFSVHSTSCSSVRSR